MSMYERLGLGIELDLQDNVSNRVSPLVAELDRLERASRDITNTMNTTNNAFSNFGRSINARHLQDMRTAMSGVGNVANSISRNLINATSSVQAFARATNSMQASANFSRIHQEVMRTQRILGSMGYGMTTTQSNARDAQAFNLMNYQLKDLQDRIKHTERGIKDMMNSPNSSRFTSEIALARRSLQALKSELAGVNQQQVLLNSFGLRQGSFMGRNVQYRSADTMGQSIANRILGASYMDVARASMRAYQSIDKTAKLMVGNGVYSAMELRTKLTALQTSLITTGMALSQFVTAPLLVATAAIGAYARTFEQAESMFQARTLTTDMSMVGIDGYKQQLASVWQQSGASYGDVSNTMSSLANMFPKRNSSDIAGLTEIGLRYKKVWGVDAVDSISSVDKIMKKYGVSSAQALDILTLGLKENNGDLAKTESYINKNIGAMKKMTEAGKEGSKAFENFAKYADDTPMARFERGLKTLANTIRILWESGIGEVFGKIGDGMTKLGNGLSTLLTNNPGLAKFLGYTLGIAGAFAIALGPIALLTGGMMQFKNILLGTSSAIFGLSRGGLALLPPQAVMAREKMLALTTAIARFPQTMGAVGLALYSAIRMIPSFLMNILKINPLIAIAGAGILAYTKNWGGFRDTVNGYVDKMQEKWKELVQMYKDSSLPDTFKTLGEYAKSFGEGFTKGLGVAVELGTYFLDFVLAPLKEMFERINPVITSVANFFDKLFGGSGDLKEGKETWEQIGKVVGAVVGSLFMLRGIMSITSILVSPFRNMAIAISGATSSVDRLITRMGALAGVTARGMGGLVGGAVGGVASRVGGVIRGTGNALFGTNQPPSAQNGFNRGGLFPTVGRFIFGSRGNNAVNGSPNILQRTGGLLMSPFTMLRNAVMPTLANYGIGSGTAMMQQRAQMRAEGMALRNNPALLASMRNAANGSLFGGRAGANMITATGLNQGTQVYQGRQSALSRALLGQRLYTYTPIYDNTGRQTGVERDRVGRTGGLLRRSDMSAGTFRPNLIQRGFGATTSFLGNGFNSLTGGMGTMMLSPFRSGFDRVTGSAVAGRFANAGRLMANRLQLANVRNPFAGALNTTNATGGALTRGQMLGNFARTSVGGLGSLAMAGAGLMGRGVLNTGRTVGRTGRFVGRTVGTVGRGVVGGARMAGRVATAPMRMIGGGLNRLMGAAPLLLAGGLLGKMAYDKLGVGKDGKKSVANVSGNIDKITAGIGKNGSKGITEFWNKFKKYGGDIMKSVGQLLVATFKALAPKIPGMMKDAWNGIKSLAKVAFNWIKGDGLKMAKSMGSGLKSILGAVWDWIKGDGVRLLGQLWTWIKGQAPGVASKLKSALGSAWTWISTKGVSLLGKVLQYILGTLVPKAFSLLTKGIGAAFKWIFTDGLKMFGNLLVSVGGIALKIGSALFKGIVSGLKGIGNAILGMLPSMGSIKSKILGMFGSGKDPKKHARGGIVNSPHLGIVGEAGPEAIIPLSGNMRGIAGQLFRETAGILGYEISPKGNKQIPAYATGGIVGGNKPQNSPVVARGRGSSTPASQDNSVTIQSMTIQFPESMAGIGEQSAKKQTQLIMKELQKRVREARLRQGNKFLSVEDVILGN